jgi:hypothetical protein
MGSACGIDAIGLIPEGGVVASAFSLWHGAAAVSQGTNILKGVKLTRGIASPAAGSQETSAMGLASSGLGVKVAILRTLFRPGQKTRGLRSGGW